MTDTAACIFCRIRDREVPGQFLYEDSQAFVIKDINPLAPVHALVIPKEHVPTVQDLSGDKLALMGHLTDVANRVAKDLGLAERGYRLVINAGPDALLSVWHLHMHVLGGHRLGTGA